MVTKRPGGRKRKHKFLFAFRAAVLTVFVTLFVGCGGSQSQEGPLKLGVLLPYSGVYAQLGEDITKGMELYFEDNNEIAGRSVELVEEDTEGDPQTGVQAARTLMEREGAELLTGSVSTAVAYGVIDLVDREQIPFVISNALGNEATRGGVEYVFRTSGSSWQVSYPMGEYLVENDVENLYVSAADYAAGQEMSDGFKKGFKAAGGNVVGEVYPPLGTNDYSSFLTRIQQAGEAQGVWNFYAGSDAVRFVKQAASSGLGKPIFGPGYLASSDTLPAQGEAAVGVQTALYYATTLDNPENEEFVNNYREKYDGEPSVYSVQGYDTAWLIGEALKETEGNTEDTQALIEAMENVEFESPRGPMELDENHNPIQNIYIREVQQNDGNLENVVVGTIENVKDPGGEDPGE